MSTSVQLMFRSRPREAGKLCNGRLLSANSDRNALASIIMHTHSPDTNLKLDNLIGRDLLLALVRVEGELRVNALALIDLTLRSPKDACCAREEIQRCQFLSGDFVDGIYRCGFDGKVEVVECLAVLV